MNFSFTAETAMHSIMGYLSKNWWEEEYIIYTSGYISKNHEFWNSLPHGRGSWDSVQFRRSVVSDSLRPRESQHTRPPCPSPTPGVYSNSCPLSRWCHPAISSSVAPFSSRLSQYQGLFKWVSSLHQVAKVLEFQLQHQSFQRIFRTDLL